MRKYQVKKKHFFHFWHFLIRQFVDGVCVWVWVWWWGGHFSKDYRKWRMELEVLLCCYACITAHRCAGTLCYSSWRFLWVVMQTLFPLRLKLKRQCHSSSGLCSSPALKLPKAQDPKLGKYKKMCSWSSSSSHLRLYLIFSSYSEIFYHVLHCYFGYVIKLILAICPSVFLKWPKRNCLHLTCKLLDITFICTFNFRQKLYLKVS